MSRISLFPRRPSVARRAWRAGDPGARRNRIGWAAGTGELPASAADGAAPLTVTVQPGQSLNDIAKAATQSRDPGCSRAGRALFDANPQAFMKRDASRLKVGATLTVPALDATGAAVAGRCLRCIRGVRCGGSIRTRRRIGRHGSRAAWCVRTASGRPCNPRRWRRPCMRRLSAVRASRRPPARRHRSVLRLPTAHRLSKACSRRHPWPVQAVRMCGAARSSQCRRPRAGP